MFGATLNERSHWAMLALGLGIFLSLVYPNFTAEVTTKTKNAESLVTLPQNCSCSIKMSCTCCQSVAVNAVKLTKTVCMIFKINLFAGNADITINYEDKTLTKMTLDPKKPPSVCLPVVSKYTPLDLCVKFNAKLDGLTDMKICSVLYCSNDGKQIMQYDFPCIKAGANGVSMA